MAGFMRTACTVILLTASTAAAQPVAAPSKAPQPDHLASSAGGGINSQFRLEDSNAEQLPEHLPAENAATNPSQKPRLAGESLWHRWNDMP